MRLSVLEQVPGLQLLLCIMWGWREWTQNSLKPQDTLIALNLGNSQAAHFPTLAHTFSTASLEKGLLQGDCVQVGETP